MTNKQHSFNWNIAIGITGLFLAALSIIVAVWAIKSAQIIAERSGSFEKPFARLQLGNYVMKEDEILPIFYGFNFQPTSVLIARLPFAVKNVGEKTLNNLTVTIRYPQIIKTAVDDELIKMGTAGIYFKKYERKFSRLEPFEYISFYFSSLNPGQTIGIGEIFNLRETLLHEKLKLENLGGDVNVSLLFSIVLNVNVAAENIQSKDYRISIAAFSAENMDGLSSRYLQYVNHAVDEYRESMSFLDYLYLCFQGIEVNEILIYPSVDTIDLPEGKLHFASEKQDDIRITTYRKAQFSKLF